MFRLLLSYVQQCIKPPNKHNNNESNNQVVVMGVSIPNMNYLNDENLSSTNINTILDNRGDWLGCPHNEMLRINDNNLGEIIASTPKLLYMKNKKEPDSVEILVYRNKNIQILFSTADFENEINQNMRYIGCTTYRSDNIFNATIDCIDKRIFNHFIEKLSITHQHISILRNSLSDAIDEYRRRLKLTD